MDSLLPGIVYVAWSKPSTRAVSFPVSTVPSACTALNDVAKIIKCHTVSSVAT